MALSAEKEIMDALIAQYKEHQEMARKYYKAIEDLGGFIDEQPPLFELKDKDRGVSAKKKMTFEVGVIKTLKDIKQVTSAKELLEAYNRYVGRNMPYNSFSGSLSVLVNDKKSVVKLEDKSKPLSTRYTYALPEWINSDGDVEVIYKK